MNTGGLSPSSYLVSGVALVVSYSILYPCASLPSNQQLLSQASLVLHHNPSCCVSMLNTEHNTPSVAISDSVIRLPPIHCSDTGLTAAQYSRHGGTRLPNYNLGTAVQHAQWQQATTERDHLLLPQNKPAAHMGQFNLASKLVNNQYSRSSSALAFGPGIMLLSRTRGISSHSPSHCQHSAQGWRTRLGWFQPPRYLPPMTTFQSPRLSVRAGLSQMSTLELYAQPRTAQQVLCEGRT
mmetsp:Transcript_43041/g.80683  ORF Transcript_43041/g.80683 Transcript_43041/m.80683 type:complete len:238 (-) Transcript_43041:1331-2044(-)